MPLHGNHAGHRIGHRPWVRSHARLVHRARPFNRCRSRWRRPSGPITAIEAELPPPPLISDALAQGLRSRLRLDPADPAVWTGTGARTIEQIIRWYTNIRSFLASGAIRYTCLASGCEGGDFAYTEEGVPRRIHLCRPFWTSSEDEQALTLIHETAHLYYGLEDTGRGAGNAGCLEEFISVVNAVNIPAFVVCPPPPTP